MTIDLKIYTKKTIKSFEKISKLHSQILDTIKQHIEIYKNFLNISKYLNSQNPSDEFILNKLEEIINRVWSKTCPRTPLSANAPLKK